MDPFVIFSVASAIFAMLGKLLGDRFNRLVTKERDNYEVRIEPQESIDLQGIRELLDRISAEAAANSEDMEDPDPARLQALELRLAALEVGHEASERQFAVQREYHSLGLAQSKVSFMLGYVFGALGALVVLAGAAKALFFADSGSEATTAALTAVAGLIPEALAALLFVSANRAGKRMDENFDRGRADRDLASAQQIAAEMQDRVLGDRLQAVLALSMARASIDEGALRLVEQIAQRVVVPGMVDDQPEAGDDDAAVGHDSQDVHPLRPGGRAAALAADES